MNPLVLFMGGIALVFFGVWLLPEGAPSGTYFGAAAILLGGYIIGCLPVIEDNWTRKRAEKEDRG